MDVFFCYKENIDRKIDIQKISLKSKFQKLSIKSLIIFLKTKIKWNVLPWKIPTSVFSKLGGLVVSLTILNIWWSRLYYWKYFLGSRENLKKNIWSSVIISWFSSQSIRVTLPAVISLRPECCYKCLIIMSRTVLEV